MVEIYRLEIGTFKKVVKKSDKIYCRQIGVRVWSSHNLHEDGF